MNPKAPNAQAATSKTEQPSQRNLEEQQNLSHAEDQLFAPREKALALATKLAARNAELMRRLA